jgi:hypothetical protein
MSGKTIVGAVSEYREASLCGVQRGAPGFGIPAGSTSGGLG